jgi:hypothetical protein
VLGGGVSKHADKWVPLLEISAPVKPAQLLNNAGIVGAAMAAQEKSPTRPGYGALNDWRPTPGKPGPAD